MAGMVVEYDTEAGAFYVRVTEEPVPRTVEVSTFVSVDLDVSENVVGLELLCLPAAVTDEERTAFGSPVPGGGCGAGRDGAPDAALGLTSHRQPVPKALWRLSPVSSNSRASAKLDFPDPLPAITRMGPDPLGKGQRRLGVDSPEPLEGDRAKVGGAV